MISAPWTREELQFVDVYLISMGPSQMIHTSGGHSLLRVRATHEQIPAYKRGDLVYNWGTFDPNDPLFIPKFLKGTMPYSLEIGDTLPYLRGEAHYTPREIIQHKIQFTLRQKERLLTRLHWWEKPEHTQYDYHIWLQNCSTKVRDVLDEATGHHIESYFQKKSLPFTYRDLWMETFGSWKLAATTADLMMNQVPDASVTAWGEMFIPMSMMHSLESMPAWNDDGSPNQAKTFLTDKQILTSTGDIYVPTPQSGYPQIAMLGALLLCVVFALKRAKMAKGFRWFHSGLSILWGLVTGLLGSAMLFMSLWSYREYFYYPSTMLLFWPLDFWWVVVGIQGLLGLGKFLLWRNISWGLCVLHLVTGVCYLVGKPLGFIPEDITRIAIYVLPFYFVFYGYFSTRETCQK